MVGEIDLRKILFIDIETVSQGKMLSELPERMQDLWAKKSRYFLKDYDESIEIDEKYSLSYSDKAAIFAEFGKIICISVGVLYRKEDGNYGFRVKSFSGEDEKELLITFSDLLSKHYNDPARFYLCGHNIREFDVPYICRRMVVNRLALPDIVNLSGKKPWETKHLIDTLELWKFGDIKHFTSLDLLTAILDIPSPKDDIDGSQVGKVYWEQKNLPRIVDYCEKDVVTVANLLLRFQGLELIDPEAISKIN